MKEMLKADYDTYHNTVEVAETRLDVVKLFIKEEAPKFTRAVIGGVIGGSIVVVTLFGMGVKASMKVVGDDDDQIEIDDMQIEDL